VEIGPFRALKGLACLLPGLPQGGRPRGVASPTFGGGRAWGAALHVKTFLANEILVAPAAQNGKDGYGLFKEGVGTTGGKGRDVCSLLSGQNKSLWMELWRL
jgi:hypothetical protein